MPSWLEEGSSGEEGRHFLLRSTERRGDEQGGGGGRDAARDEGGE